MWSAAFDKPRQLLEIKFAQHVDLAEAQACAARVEALLAEAGPGFCLLSDLSGLAEMDLACEPVIDQVMDSLNRHGVQKIVRVVPAPEKDIGFGIMSLFHYGQHVRVVTCETLEQARTHLPR